MSLLAALTALAFQNLLSAHALYRAPSELKACWELVSQECQRSGTLKLTVWRRLKATLEITLVQCSSNALQVARSRTKPEALTPSPHQDWGIWRPWRSEIDVPLSPPIDPWPSRLKSQRIPDKKFISTIRKTPQKQGSSV